MKTRFFSLPSLALAVVFLTMPLFAAEAACVGVG
jgi:ABC-type sulfate transport system permease subunit